MAGCSSAEVAGFSSVEDSVPAGFVASLVSSSARRGSEEATCDILAAVWKR